MGSALRWISTVLIDMGGQGRPNVHIRQRGLEPGLGIALKRGKERMGQFARLEREGIVAPLGIALAVAKPSGQGAGSLPVQNLVVILRRNLVAQTPDHPAAG